MSRRATVAPAPYRSDPVEEARLRGERPEPDRGIRCARCGRRYEATPPTGNAAMLVAALAVAVMMAQQDLRRRSWRDVERMAHESAEQVGAHGDDLQFGGKHCTGAFTALARGLAALSFPPGGVVFLGQHWCAVHPETASALGPGATR